MNFNTDNEDVDNMRETFAIRSSMITNELERMIEKTKRLENILRSELGLPMIIETVIDYVVNPPRQKNNVRDPLIPPPKKRTKYE
jgi:hypothetical protein|uniref:Uncharacterized protein n=1 Tax=viral metagenome TaxID=1070528 RepID=A0A6C0AT39_9ZZZZ